MFTVGLQYNFGQIAPSFSAGRRQLLVISDMLLFWCCPGVGTGSLNLIWTQYGNFAFILVV